MSFRDVSIQLTKSLTKKVKQEGGIFFTPKKTEKEYLRFWIVSRYNLRVFLNHLSVVVNFLRISMRNTQILRS